MNRYNENSPLLHKHETSAAYQNRSWTPLYILCFFLTLMTITTIVFICLFVVVLLVKDNQGLKPWQGPGPSSSYMAKYLHATVVSDAEICAPIGNHFLLIRRGHAVDAAIATLLCNGIVNLHSMGIGGGSFMLIYNRSSQSLEALNFRESAPAAASKDMYNNLPPDASVTGGLAIAVPGEILGYLEAHKKYGRLPWKDLFQPTIELLRIGVPISSALAAAIQSKSSIIINSPEIKELLFDKKTNNWKKEGDFYINLNLASTLEKIANDPDYYRNNLSSIMAKEIRDHKGIVKEEDIRSYQPQWTATIFSKMTDRNLTLHSMSTPCSGVLAIYMANILSGYDFSNKTFDELKGASLFTHRSVEAMKFTYAKRSYLGDVDTPFTKELIHNLTSISFAEATRRKIHDDRTFPPNYYGEDYKQLDDHGTTHINVLDLDGNAVAVTSTVNAEFGSRVMGNITGILYNDEMDDFSQPNRSNNENLRPSPNNYIAPGKRPMSSMSPIIALDNNGNVVLSIGASGGSKITSVVGTVLARNFFLGETLKEAIDFPRVHHQLLPDYIQAEETFPKDIIQQLKKRGHKFGPKMPMVSVQGVKILPDRTIYSNADFRKGGKSDGF